MSEREFDYIVVGAGPTGCVLASRLSADPSIAVLLLEAGPDNPPGREHPAIREPFPISLAYPQFSWPNLIAEVGPDKQNGQPRFSRQYLQGFGVGGASNIQGMIALRGLPRDYDEWRDAGAPGWGWTDVLPYFNRLERDLDFSGPMHGSEGPIPIRRIHRSDWAPFAKAFGDYAESRGYPQKDDFNADFRAGVGPVPLANLPNQRVSASMGYLDEAVRRRRNLEIRANTHVERLEIRANKIVGVTARNAGKSESYRGREVIVSGGAIHSPAILMRSGIGPGQHLKQHGIEIIRDLPAVGQNLMNHVNAGFAVCLPRHAIQPSAQRSHGQSCVHFSSGVDDSDVDAVIFALNRTAWHPLGRRIGAFAVEVHKTNSLGEVRLRSADPGITPEVKFNLLSDPRDFARLQAGLKFCLEVAADPRVQAMSQEVFLPIATYVRSLNQRNAWNLARASAIALAFEAGPLRRKILGNTRIDPKALLSSPEALRQFTLNMAGPPHHVSCTCRMGRAGDRNAVVDSNCRVFGLEGLRVIDASIMPALVRANTHLPVMMIGEKMADLIASERKAGGA